MLNPSKKEHEVPAATQRRVLALVMPALLIELAEPRGLHGSGATKKLRARHPELPVGVVLDEAKPDTPLRSEANSVLSQVNESARRLGIREGQSLVEAKALASRLIIRSVAAQALEAGLARIAEVGLGYGSLAAFSAPDTVWIDVTGVAHLFGGEANLAAELIGQIREAGHRVRVAISDGPVLAQSFARFGEPVGDTGIIVPSERTRSEVARLPVRALNLPVELESWFFRLGIVTLADMMALPSSALGARLGERAERVLALLAGQDPTPLVRYEPPRVLIEETTWEEPVDGREPLLFVLRGLVARISARLRGRGEAASALTLRILSDLGVARLQGAPASTVLQFSLPKPLYREAELRRIIGSRLERIVLQAPSLGLRLEATNLAESSPRQLELGSLLSGARTDALDELSIVLAELAAEIGQDRIGVLKTFDSHRPELTSKLVSAQKAGVPATRLKKARPPLSLTIRTRAGAPPGIREWNRLLTHPVPLKAPLRVGSSVLIDRRLLIIESVRFEQRLEAVEWWSRAIDRDYLRVVLRDGTSLCEALVYVDRETDQQFLQGILD